MKGQNTRGERSPQEAGWELGITLRVSWLLKTATLMLEMTKPVHHTGKVISMDSGFCVSVGIIAMHNFGVYGQSLIKKRRYWPKKVPCEAID